MIVSGKCRDYNKIIDNMIQSVIVNNSQDIDLNNQKDLFDRLIYLLIKGDLNNELNSEYISALSLEEKQHIFELVKQYSLLCLKNKNVHQWSDSCQGVISSDYRYISIRIVENYDFLINIIVNIGEQAVRLIDNFSIYNNYKTASVIEILRNRFEFDDILLKVLKDMCDDNSKYNTFTMEQKAILCFYAPHILYRNSDNVIYFKSPNSIALDLYRFVYGSEKKPSLGDLKDGINNISNFDDIVFNYINNEN